MKNLWNKHQFETRSEDQCSKHAEEPFNEEIKERADTTHFGYQRVSNSEKQAKVAAVFNSVAKQYDLMNDLMSFGLHRIWKKYAVARLALQPHHQVLDLAGGSGDLSALIVRQLNERGSIVLTDINANMLEVGRRNLLDRGLVKQLSYLQANAEQLPFHNNHFDRIILSFGLRNMTHKDKVLKELQRILKPGGRVVILEFSHPRSTWINKLYHPYSFKVLPLLGKLICQDKVSYQYLAESIRMHPDQETLKHMMETAGLERVEYQNLHSGIVAIHQGFKY